MESDLQPYVFNGGVIRQLDNDILLIEYSDDILIEAEHIIASRDLRKQMIGEKPYYPIIDMRKGFIKFSKGAKQWVAENKESAQIRQLDVFLVKHLGLKVEAMMYLRIFRPIVPTKVVTSLGEALNLILEHRIQHST